MAGEQEKRRDVPAERLYSGRLQGGKMAGGEGWKTLAKVLGGIALLALVFYLVSKYVVGLPLVVRSDVYLYTAAVTGVAALLSAIKNAWDLKRRVTGEEPGERGAGGAGRVTLVGGDDESINVGDLDNVSAARIGHEYHEHHHYPPPISISQPSSPIFHLPFDRNPNFTGREQLLADLRAALTDQQRAALTDQQRAALTQAISGLGGVGKTQLALEYAYRHRQAYPVVWWLAAEQTTTLETGLAELAYELQDKRHLPPTPLLRENPNQPEVVKVALAWLANNGDWLLVLDNATNPAGVKAYLPTGGAGHVLLTSRHSDWRGVAAPLRVEVLPQDKAIELLLKRSGREQAAGAEQQAAGDVAELLGGLPLALVQAGAYLATHPTLTLAAYKERFRQRRRALWQQEPPPDDYEKTVATTWALAMDEVAKTAGAAERLNLCAYLGPEAIPLWLLRTTGDEDELDEAVAALHTYSLVEASTEAVTVHRLVQAVTQDRLNEAQAKAWAEAAVRLVDDAYPGDVTTNLKSWPVCDALLPHGREAAKHAERLAVAPEAAGRLLNQMGVYLNGRAAYADARAMFERALAIDERVYGPDHPEVATDLNNLGRVLQDLGDLPAARQHIKRALAIDEGVYGPDHPTVARDLNNLGSVLKDLGDLPAARQHFERALAIFERVLGAEHPNVATLLNNLGSVLKDLGDLPAARQHYERVLKILDKTLGQEHPYYASTLNNLGEVLRALGDLPAARQHFERALAIDEGVYGPDHPAVATDLNNLGSVLRDLGDLPAARQYFERALAIGEKSFGLDHPQVAIFANNLGRVLRDLGDLPAARQHFERALAIGEKTLGPDHPEVAVWVNNLGMVLQDLGELPAARQHIERALAIFVRVLGPEHPNTKVARGNLAGMREEG